MLGGLKRAANAMTGGMLRNRGGGAGRGAAMDPGAARRGIIGAMRQGRGGPFGGQIAQRGQGGFKSVAEPAMAPTPGPPAPGGMPGPAEQAAESMKGAWQSEMAQAEPSPYGPSAIRPENSPMRMAVRRNAGMRMF